MYFIAKASIDLTDEMGRKQRKTKTKRIWAKDKKVALNSAKVEMPTHKGFHTHRIRKDG